MHMCSGPRCTHIHIQTWVTINQQKRYKQIEQNTWTPCTGTKAQMRFGYYWHQINSHIKQILRTIQHCQWSYWKCWIKTLRICTSKTKLKIHAEWSTTLDDIEQRLNILALSLQKITRLVVKVTKIIITGQSRVLMLLLIFTLEYPHNGYDTVILASYHYQSSLKMCNR